MGIDPTAAAPSLSVSPSAGLLVAQTARPVYCLCMFLGVYIWRREGGVGAETNEHGWLEKETSVYRRRSQRDHVSLFNKVFFFFLNTPLSKKPVFE